MEIKPFRAYRYDEALVGDVGNCIAPPYDVISPAQQELLYQKSEYNIARITKGKTTASDNDANNQYTRAACYLKSWIEKGLLKQDSDETIYAYVQDFQLAGTYVRRFSFIALGKLEEFGNVVRPHEQTLKGPIIDRLNLRRATAAKFGLVFMLYDDAQGIADRIIQNAARHKPLLDFTDEQGVRHWLFSIIDAHEIAAIAEMMRHKTCIIADGHHRYTTDLTYAKENPSPAASYQMLAFSNVRHEGLVILATHRLVANLENFDFEKLVADLRNNFEVTAYHYDSPQTRTDAARKMLVRMKAEYESDANAFGIYGPHSAFYLAVLNNRHAMDTAAPDKSRPWRSLDVSVLHKLILERLLGIGERRLAEGANVEYVKDTPHAAAQSIAAVDSGQKQAAFFMNPTKIEQIQMVTEQGERMPQKSTYFYPKVYTGLTINKF